MRGRRLRADKGYYPLDLTVVRRSTPHERIVRSNTRSGPLTRHSSLSPPGGGARRPSSPARACVVNFNLTFMRRPNQPSESTEPSGGPRATRVRREAGRGRHTRGRGRGRLISCERRVIFLREPRRARRQKTCTRRQVPLPPIYPPWCVLWACGGGGTLDYRYTAAGPARERSLGRRAHRILSPLSLCGEEGSTHPLSSLSLFSVVCRRRRGSVEPPGAGAALRMGRLRLSLGQQLACALERRRDRLPRGARACGPCTCYPSAPLRRARLLSDTHACMRAPCTCTRGLS